MQLLPVLVAILLGGCGLAVVLYPLYEHMSQGAWDELGTRGQRSDGQGEHGQNSGGQGYTRIASTGHDIVGAGLATAVENSQAERELVARAGLHEVELDFQLGNLDESDYRSLRERYLRRALLAMKSRHEREQELDEAIEEQLRHMREMDETHQATGQNEYEI